MVWRTSVLVLLAQIAAYTKEVAIYMKETKENTIAMTSTMRRISEEVEESENAPKDKPPEGIFG